MSLLALPLDVRRLIVNDYLCNEEALVARCACRALRALVSRARIDLCRYRLYAYFCTRGYAALLAWLLAQVPLPHSMCSDAAKGGHLATLQWLRAHHADSFHGTCAYAAAGGHLAVLQWLREHGAPWDEWTCAWATENKHLAVLAWAREHGAP